MRYFLLLIGVCFGISASAQVNIVDELQKERVGQGTVTVHQDAAISALLGSVYVKDVNETEPKVLKSRGYRVQVYAGNNSRVARQEANDMAELIKTEFPELLGRNPDCLVDICVPHLLWPYYSNIAVQ